ncbi:leucine-rich repeat-containing protein 15 [Osmerus mordax]|uniref:leucine-rich repeat-containing protein 15 n=1 Tax=Osmerus mordax TaxID=8014 RepID=UPI00350EB77F
MDPPITLYCFILLSSLGFILGGCPDKCFCKENQIVCQGKSIFDFPSGVPATTSALYISNTNIPTLKPEDFASFSEALGIFLVKDSSIMQVLPGTFDRTSNLGALGFTSTFLSDLPEALFQNLLRLESLTLSNNKLEVLRSTWLASLPALKKLDLSKNLLTSVPEEAFRYLTQLEHLTLARNNISQLSKETFRGLTRVKILRLNRNCLRQVPVGALDDLVSLEELSLQDNQVDHLHADLLSKLKNLNKLFLSSNRLTSLPQGLFFNMPNLAQISLYENELSSLVPGVFGPMALQELWLYDNRLIRLEDSTFMNLTQLRLLVLSRNQISSVSPHAFRGLEQLGEVSLHTNLLTGLEEGTFQGMPELVNISLEHNQLNSLPSKFLDGLSQMGQLDLHNNSFSNLPPETLDTLTAAREVLLAQNPWRCDQDILPLRDWLRQHPTKVNHSVVLCATPIGLSGEVVADLKDEQFGVLHPSLTPDPPEDRWEISTLAPKKSTLAPTASVTPTRQHTNNGKGEGVSRDIHIIIIAVVCTAVITSLIICCVCWRRKKKESHNLGRRSKNSVL